MRGERYPKYKPTGIAWLPEVPEGWECVRLGVLGTLSNGLSKGGESFGTGFPFVAYGDVYRNSALPMRVKGLVQSSSAEQKACSVLRGDVFFTRTSESIEEIGFSSVCLLDLDKATFAGFLIRFRPRGNEALPEFSRFYFRNFRLRVYFQLRISGLITRASLSQSVLRDLPVLLPPLPTQRAIVAYLDDKCGKIDELVAAKEKEVELLKELKQTVIADAVTRGISHAESAEFAEGVSSPRSLRSLRENNRRLVPSGIPWLPQIPEGWETAKVRQYFRLRATKVSDKDYPALSVAKIGVVPQLEDVAISLATGDSRKLVRKGDYVVNSRSDRKGSCGIAPRDGSVTTISIVLEPHDINGQFIHYLFRSIPWVEEFYRNGRGIVADLWTTNYQQMRNLLFPYPPLDEQREIVAYIEEKTAKIDQAVAGLTQQVAALKEYKQRLIADVVTGQQKVA